MARAAERDYPRETCGLVFGDDASLEVVAMENIQDRLHAEDPAAHPRDARTAYQFDSLSFDRVLKEREQQGRPLRAIYHSHPEHDAYFSRKDREDAAPPDWGPLFPDAVYIVFSVRGRRVVDVKGFAWSPAVEDYVEVTIQREDSA
jgi:proteasome lid subunit RPN8/RPN11